MFYYNFHYSQLVNAMLDCIENCMIQDTIGTTNIFRLSPVPASDVT